MKQLKLTFLLLLLFITTPAVALDLTPCNERDIKGSFTLTLYSNLFINDPETFIILDKQDDIKITPYAPNFKYKVFEGLNEKEAIRLTKEFLNNPAFVSFIKCSTIGKNDEVFGYELKPIYFPWIFGVLEPIETVYKKENNLIKVFIRLNPIVEKQIYNNGNKNIED
ncbi:MAG: hypothetical protein ABDH16_04250 [Thermodesulfovibrionaceae bacterium]